ncbi:MAG: glycosyltransferase family 4 protein [Alphaproteobacteria bacterium]|nr:glycosyltransferase family 4 protein [Alphaproteobacteria bacterium]
MRIVNVMIGRELGGIEQAFLDYNQALTLYGHTVCAVINKNAKIETFLARQNIKKIVKTRFIHYNYFLLITLYIKLRRFNPDVIIVHNKKAIPIFKILARLLHVKIIGVSHNPKFKLIDKCDGIFTITNYQKKLFAEKGFPDNRIFVIPNLIAKVLPFQRQKSFREPPVIGTMGRFDPMKGFTDFIEALGILKQNNIPYKAVIGGGQQKNYADEFAAIQKKVKELGLQDDVTFCGWVNDKEAFFNEIDIFVLPSRFEPFGIVLLEAMIHSKPIAASLAEGPAEIFATNAPSAYLFPINNPQKMAEQIAEALSNFSKTQEVARRGYDLCVEKYTLEQVGKSLDEDLRYIVSGKL